MGYGSTRSGSSVHRTIALARCLGSVLALQRSEKEEILCLGERLIQETPSLARSAPGLSAVAIECHVFVTGDAWLQNVVAAFGNRISVHREELADSRRLPHAARRFLLESQPTADLSLYLEDDLVINDRLYLDKLMWFMARTEHRFSLMPHRYEMTGDPSCPRLFIDGPLAAEVMATFQHPRQNVARGRFWDGQEVQFDVASNPHGGSFALSKTQLLRLQELGVADEGFVGPLETVATYTVLQHFPVWKTSWECRDFFAIEHGHPSYVMWRDRLGKA